MHITPARLTDISTSWECAATITETRTGQQNKMAFYGQYNESHFSLKELILTKNSFHIISEDMLSNNWGKLRVLDLRMNPWHCNCHLTWLQKYGDIKYVNELRCKSPENLTKRYLTGVDPKDMICVRMIDSLLYDKLKVVIQAFVFLLAFLIFTIAFLLLYVTQDRTFGWSRMFGTGGISTIYYQKANSKDQTAFM